MKISKEEQQRLDDLDFYINMPDEKFGATHPFLAAEEYSEYLYRKATQIKVDLYEPITYRDMHDLLNGYSQYIDANIEDLGELIEAISFLLFRKDRTIYMPFKFNSGYDLIDYANSIY